eukprot:622238-Lingulodinium_polyedra.AAC.1
MVHLMRQYWPRKKRGWVRRTECNNTNDEKCKAYKEACHMFLEEWTMYNNAPGKPCLPLESLPTSGHW